MPENVPADPTPPLVSPPAPPEALGELLVFPHERPRKLSEEVQRLIERFSTAEVTLREVIATLQGRAYDLLILILALPFILPLPVPGLSMPFGLVIALIAARLTIGLRPWLPQRLLDVRLPPRFFPRVLGAARRVVRAFEVLLKPRLPWLTASPWLLQLHAFIILIASLVLLLPLPPGTNFPPGLCILVMAAGLFERDGFFILAGYVVFALNLLFFAVLAIFGTRIFHEAWSWIAG